MAKDVLTEQQIEAVVSRSPVIPMFAAEEFKALAADAVLAQVYTGGVPLIEAKDSLEGIPFLITEYRRIASEMSPDGYVNVRITLPNMAVACFNDGGVGIMPIMLRHEDSYGLEPEQFDETGQPVAVERPAGSLITGGGRFGKPLYCPRGLRRSDYVTEIDGRKQAGTTYYIG